MSEKKEETKPVSKSKALRMVRRAELQKNWKVYPPGSSWMRRDKTIAHAGEKYEVVR
jgi:hypothetical protein